MDKNEEQQVRQVQVEASNIVEAICDLLGERKVSPEAGTLALITILAGDFVELEIPLEESLKLMTKSLSAQYNCLKALK